MPFADIARRVRHARVLGGFDPLWSALRPFYRSALRVKSRFGGVARVVNGERYRLRYPQSEVDSSYESVVAAAFRRAIFPGATVFDLGASYGLYTLMAARAVDTTGHVFAFEPSADTLALLQDHAALNDVGDRVTGVHAVVSDRAGTVSFFEQDGYGTLAAAITQTGGKYLRGRLRRVEVEATTLDDFCKRSGVWPDVVKIDVDGAEGRVLRGAREFLERRRGLVFLETHPWAVQQLGDDETDVLRTLSDAGWVWRTLSEDHNTRHYLCSPSI